MISKKHTRKALQPLDIFTHLMRNTLVGILLIVAALFIGMIGYHAFEPMSWIDAFLNASMILSGMGPASNLTTESGKLFAGFYALFSGLAFIAIVVVVLSPIIHAFFRKIHLEGKKQSKNDDI
jgi:fatty acid desaturase